MKIVSFSLLTVLALAYTGLTVAETLTYHKWERAINEQKYTQAKVAYFNNLNALLGRMVRQMALDSQHDPAIAQLLKENKIKVVVAATPDGVSAVSPLDAASSDANGPQSSTKPAPAPAGTTPPSQ